MIKIQNLIDFNSTQCKDNNLLIISTDRKSQRVKTKTKMKQKQKLGKDIEGAEGGGRLLK